MSPKFQHFLDLEASRYEELKRDIADRGVLIPIITDEAGAVIDGHQRRRVCAELHVECPSVVVPDLTEDEKHQLAIVLNLYRRQLTGMERSKVIGELTRLHLSTRRMGAILGMSKSAVQREVAKLEDRPDTVTDSLGREQPSRKPERDVSQVGHVDPATSEDAPLADENGEPLPTGGEGRKDEGGSDDAPAAAGEGVGSRSSDPAPSAPEMSPELAAEMSAAKYRTRMSTDFLAVRNGLLLLAPERMAEVSDLERIEQIDAMTASLRAWCDRVDAVIHPVNGRRLEAVK